MVHVSRTMVLAPIALIGALVVVAPRVIAAMPPLTNPSVRDAVEDELAFDPAVSLREIDVRAVDGVVTLTGTTDDLLGKERATRVAEMVKGVRSVVNRVEVQPFPRPSDAKLQNDVIAALGADPAADAYELDVSVEDGVVTLEGSVDSYQEKRLAGTVAKGVHGVRDLESRILIEYKTARPDSEIRAEIERVLRSDVLVDDGLIDVSVDGGAVVLDGTVGSAAEKSEAFFDAWVAGTKSVDTSGLEVSRWARDEDLRKDKYALRTDAEIENAVEAAMWRDPRVASFEVDATVADGVVTLRGTVDNVEARRAAIAAADHTVGTIRVRDRLSIEPDAEIGDADLVAEVTSAFARDATLDRAEIDVESFQGVVTLEGTVDTAYERARADLVAGLVEGVVDVVNRLDVEDEDLYVFDPYLDRYDYALYDWENTFEPIFTLRSDSDIEQAVEDQLWWSPYVDANEVEVSVDDGIVTLVGTVDSGSERYYSTTNAFEAGASWVENDLEVSREG